MNGLAKNHKTGLFRFGGACRVDFPMSAILSVGHLEFYHKMLCFLNALACRYETQYVSSAPCPDSTQNILGQHYLVAKS